MARETMDQVRAQLDEERTKRAKAEAEVVRLTAIMAVLKAALEQAEAHQAPTE